MRFFATIFFLLGMPLAVTMGENLFLILILDIIQKQRFECKFRRQNEANTAAFSNFEGETNFS